MQYSYSKDKLPRGWSYPFKRSVLDAAIIELPEETVDRVGYYRCSNGENRILGVQYTGNSSKWGSNGRFSISVYAVESPIRSSFANQLEEVLQKCADWMLGVLANTPVRRDKTQYFYVSVSDGNLKIAITDAAWKHIRTRNWKDMFVTGKR